MTHGYGDDFGNWGGGGRVPPPYPMPPPDEFPPPYEPVVGWEDVHGHSNGNGPAPSEDDPQPSKFIPGGSFIHDAPATIPAVWGDGDDVLWSEGEHFIICGPTGVGKTTLGGQVVAGRLGLVTDVLGYPVKPGAKKVLYLAMDRPAQIARALARQLRGHPRDVLDEQLVVWKGPPPKDIARNPTLLLAMAQHADADTVIVDSLKDAAMKLSEDETGQGVNTAFQHCVANGIEVLTYHHQRKAAGGQGGGKPTTLADVYGSTWITAGAGSVILLWGAAGDPIVELTHLKQPAGEVGPLKVVHDHTTGTSTLHNPVDILEMLAYPTTVKRVAKALNNGDEPPDNDIEKARRKLDSLVKQGLARKLDSELGKPALYRRRAVTGVTNGVTDLIDHSGVTA